MDSYGQSSGVIAPHHHVHHFRDPIGTDRRTHPQQQLRTQGREEDTAAADEGDAAAKEAEERRARTRGAAESRGAGHSQRADCRLPALPVPPINPACQRHVMCG